MVRCEGKGLGISEDVHPKQVDLSGEEESGRPGVEGECEDIWKNSSSEGGWLVWT